MTLYKERIRKAYPVMPDAVKARVEQTLSQISREAARRPPKRYARRLSFTAVLALVVVLAAGAIAAGIQFGVFDFMRNIFGASDVLPEAKQLVQTDLGMLELAHTTLRVQEAVYDGGTLHVVYSITQNGATAPLIAEDLHDAHSAFQKALAADQAHTECDWFFINGVEYGMTNASMGETAIGGNNGELLCYLNIQLASAGILPEGDFTVRLPVAGSNGQYQTLDFTVRADAQDPSRVLPGYVGGGATVTVQSAFLSPVRAYVSLHLEMEQGATPEQVSEAFADWGDAFLVDRYGNKLSKRAEVLEHNVVSGQSVDFSYTFLPTDADEVYIAPTFINAQGEWAVDMNRALRLK